jgi:hypothetical protein
MNFMKALPAILTVAAVIVLSSCREEAAETVVIVEGTYTKSVQSQSQNDIDSFSVNIMPESPPEEIADTQGITASTSISINEAASKSDKFSESPISEINEAANSILALLENTAPVMPDVTSRQDEPINSVVTTIAENTSATTAPLIITDPPLTEAANTLAEPINSAIPLNSIGKTLNTLLYEHQTYSYKATFGMGGVGQSFGDAGNSDNFDYYFYSAQAYPGLADLATKFGDELKCAGIVTTLGFLFPGTYDGMSLGTFFSAIGVSNYDYSPDIIYSHMARRFHTCRCLSCFKIK